MAHVILSSFISGACLYGGIDALISNKKKWGVYMLVISIINLLCAIHGVIR